MGPSGPDRTYAVTWRGQDGVETTCTNLSPRVAFARLWAAWKFSGEIAVIDIQPEWIADRVEKTNDWPHSIAPPDCQEGLCVINDVTGFMCGVCTLWSEENAALL